MLPTDETGKFRPPSDVIVADDKFIVRVEIAAMQTDDFRLSLLNRKLVVSGIRHLPDLDKAWSYQQVEIERGDFRLEFDLPRPVDEGRVGADYQNGILQIELPYQRGRNVPVRTETGSIKDQS